VPNFIAWTSPRQTQICPEIPVREYVILDPVDVPAWPPTISSMTSARSLQHRRQTPYTPHDPPPTMISSVEMLIIVQVAMPSNRHLIRGLSSATTVLRPNISATGVAGASAHSGQFGCRGCPARSSDGKCGCTDGDGGAASAGHHSPPIGTGSYPASSWRRRRASTAMMMSDISVATSAPALFARHRRQQHR
jgi:hypothetical protein